MAKRQYISWATILLILGAYNASISNASAISSEPETIFSAPKSHVIAQNSDDEMLDSLEERQKKIDGKLDKIRELTGTESEKDKPERELSNEEMIDAIKNRQKKLQELKELKKLEDLAENQEKLEGVHPTYAVSRNTSEKIKRKNCHLDMHIDVEELEIHSHFSIVSQKS